MMRRLLLVAAPWLLPGLAALFPAAAPAGAAEPLRDAPVAWHEDDRNDIPKPAVRDPNLVWDGIDESFVRPVARVTNPGRLLRRVGTIFGGDHVPPAANLNALDEVPNSAWFTNRIGHFPMTPEEVAHGVGMGDGPDPDGPWTVVRAKTEGVTPGFNIRDGRGDVYVIKFDHPDYQGMASAAGVITGRVLHAAGYNVPEDFVVMFDPARLRVAENVTLTLPDGSKRPMTAADIDTILARVPSLPDGRKRALASRFLAGEPVGPFDWKGRRRDDPNDRIDHENRRELRGFKMIAAWLDHFDTKQGNTLDMYVEEGGRRYLRHHFIDFASTLGGGAGGPARTYGYEYSFDVPAIGGRVLALGFHEDAWRRLTIPPGLDEVGYFQDDTFDPLEFKGLLPNAAYANLTERDGYWAAKIISAFRDDHLAALVAAGQYRNPEAAAWITRMLAARRDRIARLWFDRVPPLDFFRYDAAAGRLTFHDLGAERGIYPGTTPRYRVRARRVDAGRDGGRWSDWRETAAPEFTLDSGASGAAAPGDPRPFLAFECQVDRGEGWSRSIAAFAGPRDRGIVAVER